ncbi:MAG TPA: hypothetical protein VNN73_16770 [Blastocatellia bacterium]|nr:hypothetical protein [Blastocatellia bacterium]
MKMAAGQMFTAFDITLALQKKRVRMLHREIRRDIRIVADDLMWRYGYERTLVGFKQINASAFVYHPFGTDASLHRPSIRPCSLATEIRQKPMPFTGPRLRPRVDRNRRDDSFMPAGIAHANVLNVEDRPSVVVEEVSRLLIITKGDGLE